MIDVFLTALLLGASSAGLTKVVRTIAPEKWLHKRPIVCDVCMTFWTVLGFALLARSPWLAATAAYPFGLWVLDKISEPKTEYAIPEE